MDFIKNLAALIKVKTIVTLAVMAVLTYLAVTGAITADNVMIVVSTVIAFYFGTQYERRDPAANAAPGGEGS
jgi:hypothetical protein